MRHLRGMEMVLTTLGRLVAADIGHLIHRRSTWEVEVT
jgi:hypothetical protein